LCRPAAPFVVVVEQIQDRSKAGGNTAIGGEWPWAIDNMQDHVCVRAGLQAVASNEQRQSSGRDVCLKNAWRHDLESVLDRRADPAGNHVRLRPDPWKIRGVSAQLQPSTSAKQRRENVL
jgi:hypothetical protein